MASLLESKFAKQIARGFKGKLLKGVIQRNAGATRDAHGDTIPGAPVSYAFEGVREDFSAFIRAQAGIPDTDVKILFITGLTLTVPMRGDYVKFRKFDQWYHLVKNITKDTAEAHQVWQASVVPPPAGAV